MALHISFGIINSKQIQLEKKEEAEGVCIKEDIK